MEFLSSVLNRLKGIVASSRGFLDYLSVRLFLALLLILPASSDLYTASSISKTFGMEDRVACQTTIEEIRWAHRIWPEENKQPKPALFEILSQDQIRAKVENSLRMEAALEGIYGIVITDAMLQAEINRMAESTKAPERLQELFNALRNDPTAIAECLARPELVRQNLYNNYVWDSLHHQELRDQAETALADMSDPAILFETGGEEYLLALLRKEDKTEPEPLADESDNGFQRIELDADEFGREVTRLTGDTGRDSDVFSSSSTTLRETENSFVYEEVLSQTENRLEVRSLVWQKQGFNTWWASQSGHWSVDIRAVVTGKLHLPVIAGDTRQSFSESLGNIAADTWVVWDDSPTGRIFHTVIWTGSEMIVWGGWDGTDSLNSGWRYDPVADAWMTTSTSDVPSGRASHTAIWTGSKMMVWGGSDGSIYLDTGGRYDPATDSWTATNNSGAPGGRYRHTAVWTGSEMIVWGGDDGSIYLDTGGRYDPATDSWTTTNTSGAPSGRNSYTTIWTGNEMIVWGGDDGSIYLNTGGRYDPETDSWTATNTNGAPSGRYSHTAIWIGSEMIVWGGLDDFFFQATGARYDPVTDSWTATNTSGAPNGRYNHTAIWTGSEMIVWGGWANEHLNTGGSYDPVSDSWTLTNTSGAPSGRSRHTAIWTGSEMIIWGGNDGSYLETGGRYNPATDSWTATKSSGAAHGRSNHTVIWTGSEMIIWGGRYFSSPYLNTGGRYDPATDAWTPMDIIGAPSGREYHTAIWSGSEMFIWGGYRGASNFLSTGGRYDPVTDGWMPMDISGAPSERSHHTAIWTGNEMIVWGGWDFSYLQTGGRYDPISDSWTLINTNGAPSGRFRHTAIWSGNEMIVWGGNYIDETSNYLDTGGRYNPTTDSWVATNIGGAPDGRRNHTAIWTGSEMIVWGGYDGTYTKTGGRYSPVSNSWMVTNTSGAPSARSSHTAIWTGSEMIVWGGAEGGYSNTGGRYDPVSDDWMATDTSGAPQGRANHTAIWTGNQMIIWGGAPYINSIGIYYPYEITCTSCDADAINLSARAKVGTGREVLNTSAVVIGSGTREFLAMARGPSMAATVPGTLDDPILRVVDISTMTVVVEVDDWQDDPVMAEELTSRGLAPTHSNEAAAIVELSAGSYTVQVLGVNGTTGIGQASLRELDSGSASAEAINLSARAKVGVEREVLNTSAVVVGSGTREFLAMARGPSMADSVPGTLADPILRVVDVATMTVIAEVDDWQDDPVMAEALTSRGLAPTHPKEAATIVELSAGSYTVQVLGVNGTTGIGQASIREL